MKRQCILSFCLLIIFLAGWTLNYVVNTHNHPPELVQQFNTFVDKSGLIAIDKEEKKVPFVFVQSQKYNETLIVRCYTWTLFTFILHHSATIYSWVQLYQPIMNLLILNIYLII